jgi:hypothetical protein
VLPGFGRGRRSSIVASADDAIIDACRDRGALGIRCCAVIIFRVARLLRALADQDSEPFPDWLPGLAQGTVKDPLHRRPWPKTRPLVPVADRAHSDSQMSGKRLVAHT